ncbi:MAG: hypothetical protein B6245_01575 [Desulfobacteraceae bacterium 4572_88]|nr:MAG: hypothetical protein B6245_01575 [Desulfobacteraceae bacterium 4572_88]
MYENFFGFKERPFQLVPNPDYLFLSKSHEEALAHLAYAVSQGDGFVEITGEVGTGKTTLCRVFLENLDQNTEAAYIFNPKLNAVQLLKAINDELGINSKGNNTKILIDRLNFFLMEKKAEGKRVILVIDEAQNLSKEVLEQLRLLSNLETTTAKLLQIILIGQPELAEILDSHELRQLAQRITLSYHLVPLNLKETREYIEHRIRIASRKSGIRFTLSALRAVYKYSGGIPRLINIACDRSILTAYGLNQHKITGSIAKTSIRELAARGDIRKGRGFQEGKKPILILSVLCLILILLVSLYPPDRIRPPETVAENEKPAIAQPEEQPISTDVPAEPEPEEPPEPEPPEPEVSEMAVEPEPEQPPAEESDVAESPSSPDEISVQNLGDFMAQADSRISRHMALGAAASLWNAEAVIREYLDNMEDAQAFFRLGTKQSGLLVQRVDGDFDLVRKLNLPTVFELYLPNGVSPVYLTLATMGGDGKMTFRSGDDGTVETEMDELEVYWPGTAYVVWKNFFDYPGSLPRGATDDSLITLKMILRDIGFSDIEISPVYDDQTRVAVEEIQEKHGVTVDGVVGPQTKIILYNEMTSLDIPRLSP